MIWISEHGFHSQSE